MNFRKGLFADKTLSSEELFISTHLEIVNAVPNDIVYEILMMLIQEPKKFVHLYGIKHQKTGDIYGVLFVDKLSNETQDEYCINIAILDERLMNNEWFANMFQHLINQFHTSYQDGKEKYIKCNISEMDAMRCYLNYEHISDAAQKLADSIIQKNTP